MNDLPMFFVFGLPRSGTTWLAALLAEQNKDWMIIHEAHKHDFDYDYWCPFQPWRADEYVNGKRHTRMVEYTKRKMKNATGYGEVTPRARYFSATLQRHYPQAKCVHLVRDPRHAVRSMIQLGYYAPNSRPHRRVTPNNGKWSRIEQTSWAWAFGHNRIRQTCPDFVRLEDLLTDWETMSALASTLGVSCDKANWEERTQKPMNVSNQTHLGWEKWTPSEQKTLITMCGSEARQYGYLAE